MAIWQLYPIDSRSPEWKNSTYRGPVIVRAGSEEAARALASIGFCQGPEAQCPWSQPYLVSARLVAESGYIENGRAEILGPPNALAAKLDASEDNL